MTVVFFTTKRHKMTRKNFMGSTMHAGSQRRTHEIFSCYYPQISCFCKKIFCMNTDGHCPRINPKGRDIPAQGKQGR